MPEALGINLLDESRGDAPWLLAQIDERIVELGGAGRIATWPLPPDMLVVEAGTRYAVAWIASAIKERNDKDALQKIME